MQAERQLREEPEALRQALLADVLIVTKTDLATPETAAALGARLDELNPTARRTMASRGDVDPDLLFPERRTAAAAVVADERLWHTGALRAGGSIARAARHDIRAPPRASGALVRHRGLVGAHLGALRRSPAARQGPPGGGRGGRPGGDLRHRRLLPSAGAARSLAVPGSPYRLVCIGHDLDEADLERSLRALALEEGAERPVSLADSHKDGAWTRSLVRNGTVVPDRFLARLDVAYRDWRFAALLAPGTAAAAAKVVDASGKHVFPGLIDATCTSASARRSPSTTERFTPRRTVSPRSSGTPQQRGLRAVYGASRVRAHAVPRRLAFHFSTANELHRAEFARTSEPASPVQYFMNFKGEEGRYLGLDGTDDGYFHLLQGPRASATTIVCHTENIELVNRTGAVSNRRGGTR